LKVKANSLIESKFHKDYKPIETKVFETSPTSGKKTTEIKAYPEISISSKRASPMSIVKSTPANKLPRLQSLSPIVSDNEEERIYILFFYPVID
jgi:hypothetical protein